MGDNGRRRGGIGIGAVGSVPVAPVGGVVVGIRGIEPAVVCRRLAVAVLAASVAVGSLAGAAAGPNDRSHGDAAQTTPGAGDAGGSMLQQDADGDYVPDFTDNCPDVQNPDQANANGDAYGDACQPPPDADGDTVPDGADNCLTVPNSSQTDDDRDGVGNACDDTPQGDAPPGDTAPAGTAPAATDAPPSIGSPADAGEGTTQRDLLAEGAGTANTTEPSGDGSTETAFEGRRTGGNGDASGKKASGDGDPNGKGSGGGNGGGGTGGEGTNSWTLEEPAAQQADLLQTSERQPPRVETPPTPAPDPAPSDQAGGGGQAADGGGGDASGQGGGGDRNKPRKNTSLVDTLPPEPPPVPRRTFKEPKPPSDRFDAIARIDAGNVEAEPTPPPESNKTKRNRSSDTGSGGTDSGAGGLGAAAAAGSDNRPAAGEQPAGDGGAKFRNADQGNAGQGGDGADAETGDNQPAPVADAIAGAIPDPIDPGPGAPRFALDPAVVADRLAALNDPALAQTGEEKASAKRWSADEDYRGGTYQRVRGSLDIAGTKDDAIYMTQRVGVDRGGPGAFIYEIPVPKKGTYRVRLHFAELLWGTSAERGAAEGKRVFSVSAEGKTELKNYDIYADVGALTAVVKQFDVAVSDGSLTLRFSASRDQPVVSAIEVLAKAGKGSKRKRGDQGSPAAAATTEPVADAARRRGAEWDGGVV